MKAKTPALIYAQWRRIAQKADTPKNIERAKRAADLVRVYWDNIYNLYGVNRHTEQNTQKINYLWKYATAPVEIYTKRK